MDGTENPRACHCGQEAEIKRLQAERDALAAALDATKDDYVAWCKYYGSGQYLHIMTCDGPDSESAYNDSKPFRVWRRDKNIVANSEKILAARDKRVTTEVTNERDALAAHNLQLLNLLDDIRLNCTCWEGEEIADQAINGETAEQILEQLVEAKRREGAVAALRYTLRGNFTEDHWTLMRIAEIERGELRPWEVK